MNNDLLVSLRKYNTTAKKNPVENFITESFAWMLNNNKDFSITFLNYLSNKLDIKENFETHSWKTQVNFNGFFPDLVCSYDNKAFIFEIKAYSPLHDRQLENYREYACNEFSDYKLILITANNTQHSQDPDLALCWKDIYKLIENFRNKYSEGDFFILDNFIKLLESEGLGPAAPISHESILYYFKSKNFVEQIKKIANFQKNVFSAIVDENDINIEYRDGWGRVGVVLLRPPYIPGIFIGFLLDGSDHKTTPILGDISPDFEIIIDFDAKLHTIYPGHILYNNFVSELIYGINKIGDSWELYNHLQDKNIEKHNLFHPIHIRKPVIELLRGTKTWEEQEKRVHDAILSILPLVYHSENFKKMREEFLKFIN